MLRPSFEGIGVATSRENTFPNALTSLRPSFEGIGVATQQPLWNWLVAIFGYDLLLKE